MELTLSEEQLLPELISCRLYDSSRETLTAGHRTRLRTTQSYEFSIYLTEGGTLCLPDGDVPIRPGLCRFAPPGTRLCSIPHYKAYTVYFSLAPEDGGRIPHVRNPFLDAIPLCYTSRMPELYRPLLDRLSAAAFSTELGAGLARRQLLLELLLLIFRDATAPALQTATSKAVELVKTYLEQHLSQEINLDSLGELTGYHPLYLQRVFKHQTGSTPHNYLTQLRLRKARQLLTLTSLPVSQIAQQCGYSSVSHFTNLFRKTVGCTPLIYRTRGQILP